jgi:hypothetical protein
MVLQREPDGTRPGQRGRVPGPASKHLVHQQPRSGSTNRGRTDPRLSRWSDPRFRRQVCESGRLSGSLGAEGDRSVSEWHTGSARVVVDAVKQTGRRRDSIADSCRHRSGVPAGRRGPHTASIVWWTAPESDVPSVSPPSSNRNPWDGSSLPPGVTAPDAVQRGSETVDSKERLASFSGWAQVHVRS